MEGLGLLGQREGSNSQSEKIMNEFSEWRLVYKLKIQYNDRISLYFYIYCQIHKIVKGPFCLGLAPVDQEKKG